MHVNVRSLDVGRVGVCMLCVDDSEKRDRGVGASVNATMLSETLQVVGLVEDVRRAVFSDTQEFFLIHKKTVLDWGEECRGKG